MESAIIPPAGELEFFQEAEFAFVPSVSAVIVTDEVVDGVVDDDEEQPLTAQKTNAKRKAEVIVVINFFIIFVKVRTFVQSTQ